ncbi:uncharacterized protein LOC111337572 [Stylophora pistillata]|nr:uncharacterized protein LOC111337572 [Stylophora pistillata]
MYPSASFLMFFAATTTFLVHAKFVTKENIEPENILFEKNARVEDEMLETIYKEHHGQPHGFVCLKGNATRDSNVVRFDLRHYHRRADKLDRTKAMIYLEMINPAPYGHPFFLSFYDAMTKKMVAQARAIPGFTRNVIVLDVTEIARHWLQHPESDHSFKAVYQTADPTKFPRENTIRKFALPLMVIIREDHLVSDLHAERNRRSSEQQIVSRSTAQKLACSRRDFHIETRQFPDGMILQPITFNAYD